MATVSVTTTAAQDAAINRRRLAHNSTTGQSLTAVQYGVAHIHALFDGWVSDDARSAHRDIRDRWERSTQAQRDAAAAELAP